MKKIIYTLIALTLSVSLVAFANIKPTNSRIYFFGDLVGPGVNIFSIDMNKTLQQHTADKGSRDIDFALDNTGNMVITSNRIENRQPKLTKPSARKMGTPQDFNVYLLPKNTLEQEDEHLAKAIVQTQNPDTQGNISPDGQWVSYVTTFNTNGELAHEQLYLKNLKTEAIVKIASDELIIKTHWSPDSTKLLYSTHNYTNKTASTAFYNVQTKANTSLLSSKDENFQIDSPQWSPDGLKISLIKHPLVQGQARQLFVLNLQTKELLPLSAEGHQVQAPISWSNNSNQLVYSALVNYKQYWHDEYRRKMYEGGAQLFLSDLKGSSKQLTTGETQMHRQPVFSPDDNKIAYMFSEQAPGKIAELRIIDKEGKLIDTLYDKVAGVGYLKWQ